MTILFSVFIIYLLVNNNFMAKFIKKMDQENDVAIEKSPENKVKKPSLYKVVMLNDDYTPMDFVVYLLKTFFQKNHNDASKIMY